MAYLGDVKETRAVRQWATGQRVPSDQVANRLRPAYRAAAMIAQKDTPAVVQAWFQRANPHLDEGSPAHALRDPPLDEAGQAVLTAAKAFAARG